MSELLYLPADDYVRYVKERAMEDLLNENNTPETYNPWPYFLRFYIAGFLSVFLLYFYSKGNLLLILFVIAGPLWLGPLMMWGRKRNFLLPRKTIAKAIFYLNLGYFACMCVVQLLNFLNGSNKLLTDLVTILIVYIVTLTLSGAMIFSVADRKQRKAGLN